jgi:hypothetical protein
MILNSGHETPLNDMVTALKQRFQSGKTLKDELRPMLFNSARPQVSSADDELYYAIDKGLFRLEVSENQQARVDETTGFMYFECPIILHALLPRIFPEVNQSFQTEFDNISAINSVKNLPGEFPTLLKGFIHQLNIDTLQGSRPTCRTNELLREDPSLSLPILLLP